MAKKLWVYYDRAIVGVLFFNNNGKFCFQYDESWLNNKFPISFALPLQKKAFEPPQSIAFFSNLLPEGDVRNKLCAQLHLSPTNDFALLKEIGWECAGALSILDIPEYTLKENEYTDLPTNKLTKLISSHNSKILLHPKKDLRLSLAGAQDKLPIYYHNDHFYLPKGNSPTSHIIKPNIDAYPSSVENEFFCMRLAKLCGLNVAEVYYFQDKVNFILVNRFDRTYNKNIKQMVRLHQEDFCQALSILPGNKYQNEGGPTLTQCLTLIKEYSRKITHDINQFIQLIIFNYLIGNNDAHGKNIAILYDPEPHLAPFYDLLSTEVYPEIIKKMAMSIGKEYRPNFLMKRHWQAFAKENEIKFSYLQQIASKLCNNIMTVIKNQPEKFDNDIFNQKIVNSIIHLIKQKINKLMKDLSV